MAIIGAKADDGIITVEELAKEKEHGDKLILNGNYNYQELETSDKGNTTAKNIKDFKLKVTESKGYYIGRYEARDRDTKAERTNISSDKNQLTCTAENYIYNYISQIQAAKLSRNMYNNSNFESDLINSYAWDTAIMYLQEFDNRENKTYPYSMQITLNSNLEPQGTNKIEDRIKQDKICNIFDMASNLRELSTETYSNNNSPATVRGGNYTSQTNSGSSNRSVLNIYVKRDYTSFRPILYL